MNKSGLSFDVAKFRKIMAEKKRRVSASSFRPQFEKFVSRSLTRAIADCPVRDLALITSAQEKQYEDRVNYIPSIHWPDADPRMVVRDNGHWVFVAGKWYNASLWKLPPDVLSAYEELNAERERRLKTPKTAFIANRAQARFLYIKQFLLIGRALGVRVISAVAAMASHSRRQPQKEPAMPNAQWRGGKDRLGVSISAPMLSTETAYWEGKGIQILSAASDAERPRFTKEVREEIIKRISE